MGNRLDLSQVIFLLLVMIHGSAVLATFREYGVNPDEAAHIDYGHSVFLWYQSLFQQRGVFSRINIWLYGGLYDTLVHLVTRISPLGLHDTRHLCNATVGIVGIWGAYKLGGLYGKRWFGLLAALFLLLTPRYYGHSFINHKDIPFAAAYLWSVYLIAKAITRLPQLSIRMLLSLGCPLVSALASGLAASSYWATWVCSSHYATCKFYICRASQEKHGSTRGRPTCARWSRSQRSRTR